MKKEIFFDTNALKELQELNSEVQKEFQAYIVILSLEGKLEFPEARKVTKDIFEIRVAREGAFRGFYAYLKGNYIIMLHFFQKKTQKTNLRNVKVAQQRLKKYE